MSKDTSNETGSPKYWLSLEQWRQDPEFQKVAENEFMSSPLANSKEGGWARREFLKLMGASMALTSFGCIRRPAQKIVPYVNRPEDVVQGIYNYYASSYADGNEGFGLVVTTREGRPTKVDGNSEHPLNMGGMSARAHGHILSLYDPDRLTGPRRNLLNKTRTNRDTVSVSWKKADEAVVAELKKGRVGLLMGSTTSPSTKALVRDFAKGFGAETYTWDPLNDSIRDGQARSYGRSVVPRLRYDKAKLILAIDADFLGATGSPAAATALFAKGRKPGEDMSELVVFESLFSLTGTNADHRHRIRPSQQLDVVMGLLHEIIVKKSRSRYAGDGSVKNALEGYANAATELGIAPEKLTAFADKLWKNRGQSLVVAGGLAGETKRALALQVATNFLNTVLGNDGVTVDHENGTYRGFQGSDRQLKKLVDDINSGKVKRLVIHGVNPAYSAPADLGFMEALKKVEVAIYTGDRIDETGKTCEWVLPDHHSMENWGDAEFLKGVYSIQQPTIRPLYDTRAFQDTLISWARTAGRGSTTMQNSKFWFDYMRSYWRWSIHSNNRKGIGVGDFDKFWIALLQVGVFDTVGNRKRNSRASSRNFDTRSLRIASKKVEPQADFELVIYSTVGLRDGSLANVSWLQEFPDPVSKICWDNYISLSPQGAKNRKVKEGDIVKLKVGEKVLEGPVHVQPGQHDHVVGLAVGYGRTDAGQVANGVGLDAYPMISVDGDRAVYSGLLATIEKVKDCQCYQLANVQGHHSIDHGFQTMHGRQIVVEATLNDYLKDNTAGIHKHAIYDNNGEVRTMWEPHKYEGHKWGMTVDLNSCTGCGSCVIACQSENNIPTVGKRYVLEGREMHWIRIDRYYTGEESDPDAVHMPVLCQHCDNAPCETVCPVAATTHGDEGTNDMIYNRCVGTRYCANNCPYKVRRFNWFDYTEMQSPLHMALNPEVTVRDRGVMEKCTFCTHKITYAKNEAKNEGRSLRDGDVVAACEASCPAKAIVFGDSNDPESRVSKSMKDERNYTLLEELNNKPAVHYKSKIRNYAAIKSHGGDGGGH